MSSAHGRGGRAGCAFGYDVLRHRATVPTRAQAVTAGEDGGRVRLRRLLHI